MSRLRVREAASLLGVSPDTIRRLVESGELSRLPGEGPAELDGAEVARLLRERATDRPDLLGIASSARNRLTGLVTDVTIDGVMAEVVMACGPFTITSLMSASSARSLGLEPGSLAVAVIKATTVIVEAPEVHS